MECREIERSVEKRKGVQKKSRGMEKSAEECRGAEKSAEKEIVSVFSKIRIKRMESFRDTRRPTKL